MKKKIIQEKTLTISMFLSAAIIFSLPLVILSYGAPTDSFSVSTNIGNAAPTIPWVNTTGNSPVGGGTRIIQINFTGSDANGYTDLNYSSAYINISRSGVIRQSTYCLNQSTTATTVTYLCNITIYWYDEPGSWSVAAYVRDNQNQEASNTTAVFTMGNTDDVTLLDHSISFTGAPGQENRPALENPLTANNTGNQNYTIINITAFDLESGGSYIGTTNFSVNVSDSSYGTALLNNTPVTIPGAALIRNQSSTEDLYFYLDIPSGVANAIYSSTANWIIDPN